MTFRRTILKQDLAVKLYPQSSNINAAMQLLRKEIKLSPEFNNRLDLLTRNKRAHYYTHKELEIILDIFVLARRNLSCYRDFLREIMVKRTKNHAKTSSKAMYAPINR